MNSPWTSPLQRPRLRRRGRRPSPSRPGRAIASRPGTGWWRCTSGARLASASDAGDHRPLGPPPPARRWRHRRRLRSRSPGSRRRHSGRRPTSVPGSTMGRPPLSARPRRSRLRRNHLRGSHLRGSGHRRPTTASPRGSCSAQALRDAHPLLGLGDAARPWLDALGRERSVHIGGLHGAAMGFFLAAARRQAVARAAGALLVLVPDVRTGDALRLDLEAFSGCAPLGFPTWPTTGLRKHPTSRFSCAAHVRSRRFNEDRRRTMGRPWWWLPWRPSPNPCRRRLSSMRRA